MGQEKCFKSMFPFLTILALGLVCYVESNSNLDFPKVNTTRNISSEFSSTDRILRLPSVKKWQVGRVSRKHYEIVNMLWRKTKIFVNPETTIPMENRHRRNSHRTTRNYENIKPLTHTTSKPLSFTSTASYIEFYYLDDSDERVKRRDSLKPKLGNLQRKQQLPNENIFLQSPILSFRGNDHSQKTVTKGIIRTNKPKSTTNLQIQKYRVNEKPSIYGFLSSRFKIGYGPVVKPNPVVNLEINYSTTTPYFDNETCPSTTMESYFGSETNSSEVNILTEEDDSINDLIETTVYDKIKFFEMYDDHTITPLKNIEKVLLYADDPENFVKLNEISVDQKINLEDVHQRISQHDNKKSKNVKKHIDLNVKLPAVNTSAEKLDKKLNFKTVMFNINKTAAELRSNSRKTLKNSSRVASWSDYPFAAVYVYEPSQIHCDAAALSPHWLVAAGSCLSRFHNKEPETEGRSAFVAYCGQSWWRPERVAYVKYSIVHPRFHPKDYTRRYLYNIGLIQVSATMSSCFGWAPVSLMSHHFATDSDGSIATAVGWGLDRYDVRHSPVVLPRQRLSAYDSFVYSESCPGSTTFEKGKLINEENIVRNTYCLSLPPYFGEQKDPIHGSLLLVGGKLIALYLQEERRVWGEQSAQYTGVWRLVPWVHEVAHEPDEVDGFAIDL